LLGSHCIVLVHHYLDTLVHCCPGKLWEGAGEAVAKVSKQRQRRSKRRNKLPPPQEAQQQQGGEEVRVATVGCTVCGEQFTSRNQLFKHIKKSGHAAPPDGAPNLAKVRVAPKKLSKAQKKKARSKKKRR